MIEWAHVGNAAIFLGLLLATSGLLDSSDDDDGSSSEPTPEPVPEPDFEFDAGNYDDTLQGGPEAESYDNRGSETATAYFSGGGPDTVLAGEVNDYIESGDGDDVIDAGAGDDAVYAGEGDDFVSGLAGDDIVVTGAGDDTVLGLGGDDYISGEGGADDIEGNTGDDSIFGGNGDDLLAGGGGTDVVGGGNGNDIISSDRLDAEADFGRGGAETLSGGAGDDWLVFADEDQVGGGTGADRFSVVDVTGGETGPATISDFNRNEDVLEIVYQPQQDPETGQDRVPEVTVSTLQSEDTGSMTSVRLDDTEIVRLVGGDAIASDEVRLVTREELDQRFEEG